MVKKDTFAESEFFRIILLIGLAGLIGAWAIANTVMITRDGVYWIECASSTVAKLLKMQDMGLPLMILGWHQLLSCFGMGEGNLNWVMAAQTLVLICRILSLVPLYYLGKLLVGKRHAFWAVLILIVLPWPAEWGHDALREWPHLLFLSGGLLMVLLAFTYRRIIFFLPAGILAGVGHTIRPEGAQVIIYALVALFVALIYPRELMTRKKTVLGALLLMLGFATIFVPYFQIRGEILPLKLQQLLTTGNTETVSVVSVLVQNAIGTQHAGFFPVSMQGVINLVQHLSENLYYYFFPFMLVGLYVFLRPGKKSFGWWFIAGFIFLNILMHTALYHHSGYISRRHLLPLTAMAVFFVPLGIETVAGLFSRKKTELGNIIDSRRQGVIFIGLIVVGILACVPKLAKPIGTLGFRKTADYLKQNTPLDAIVAVPEKRIAFYAERNGVIYKTPPTRGKWDYLVTIEKCDDAKSVGQMPSLLTKVYSHPLQKAKRNAKEIVVYRRKKRQ